MSTPRTARRHWLTLRVRTLLALVLVAGGALGWLVHRTRVQREAVAAIVRSGGKAYYDWEVERVPASGGTRIQRKRNARPRWPRWLVSALGHDYFSDVRLVYLAGPDSDAVMRSVGRLTRLEGLKTMPRASLTDAGMAHLRGLHELRSLELPGSRISRVGLEALRGKTRLERLDLRDIPLTDDDLVPLGGVVNLRGLSINSRSITNVGLAHLGGLTGLRRLFLAGAQIDDLAPIRHLVGLEYLGIPLTRVTDAGLAPVANFPRLDMIAMGSNANLTDHGLRHLAGLKRLRTLHIRNTMLTDEGIAALRKALPQVRIVTF